jgi:hypothetical protein
VRPPDDLKDWSKKDLMREVARLRAVLHEFSNRVGDDARGASTPDPIVGGSPSGRGDALLDARSAVLLDGVEVVLVDTKQDEPVVMLLSLSGRINYADDRVTHAYLFGPDGAAGLVTELLMLAARADDGDLPHGQRFAQQFREDLSARMEP